VCVIHMGGAQIVAATADLRQGGTATGGMMLVPDPAAQNNRVDLPSAEIFYMRAQSLSVPLLILSRHLAQSCRLPRALFDVLTENGGSLGKILGTEQRIAIEMLWLRATAPAEDLKARSGLPPRCDGKWFCKTFCNGREINGVDDVWPNIESINVYNPISLLAALRTGFLNDVLDSTPVELYSALHRIVGLSQAAPGIKDAPAVRRIVCQCIIKATMTNQSKFDFETPPPVSVIFEGERSSTTSGVWSYNQTDELMSFGQSANAGKGVQRRQAPKRVQTCGDLKMGKQMV